MQKEIPWFYHPDLSAPYLHPDEARHAASAWRLQPGAACVLTTGAGQTASAQIVSVKKAQVEVFVQTVSQHPALARPKTLVIARLHHADRMEWLIEKAQELGLYRLIIADMAQCGTGHLTLDRARRIAISALKQSHQAWLTEIVRVRTLAAATALLPAASVYGFLPHAGAVPVAITQCTDTQAVIIGPEADFSTDELSHLNSMGYKPVALGQTRLRAETAGMAAAVFLQTWV